MRTHVRMFQPRFAADVAAGRKLHTIRQTPKILPKVGERISLRQWQGKPYRSKQIVLAESTITRVAKCIIQATWAHVETTGFVRAPGYLNVFARADGFANWLDMVEWFRTTHGLPFEGMLIEWAPPALGSPGTSPALTSDRRPLTSGRSP